MTLSVREDGAGVSTKDRQYDHVLRYIAEAIDARSPLVQLTGRAIQAYRGYPMKDKYIGKYEAYAKAYIGEDNDRYQAILDNCKSVVPKQNFTVMEAIDTMVAQSLGGVARYEAEVYNPYFSLDPDVVDRLNSGAKAIWADNKVDAILPQMIETAGLSGSAYLFLEKKPNSDKQLNMTIIPATEMLIDPIRTKRNNPRYRGHQTKKSWQELKKHLLKTDLDEYQLLSLNEVDTYLSTVSAYINKHNGDFTAINNSVSDETLRRHLDMFYKPSALAWNERRTKYTDKKVEDKYVADEVEVIYLFDYTDHVQYTVINRHFIIEAKKNYLAGSLDYTYPTVDPATGLVSTATSSAKVQLDDPYVALEYKRSTWVNYAYSPIVDLLDAFDDLCALESLIYHTISVMTPITFTGNPTDVEKLAKIVGVSGEVIKGFIANSVTTLNKVVDITPALTELARIESRIKWILNGPDAIAQSQLLHDRASGTEAGMTSGVISQGLNQLLTNIEAFASELAEKSFKLLLINSGNDWEYNFPMNEQIATLSREELVSNLRFKAILKNRMRMEARQNANTIIQWFVPLVQSQFIPNKEQMVRDIVPLLSDSFSAKQVQGWFEKTEGQKNLEEAQMQYMLSQQNNSFPSKVDLADVNPYGANNQFSNEDVATALGGTPPAAPYKPANQESSRALQHEYSYGRRKEEEELNNGAITPTEISPDYDIEYAEPELEEVLDDELTQDNYTPKSNTWLGINDNGGEYQINSNRALAGDDGGNITPITVDAPISENTATPNKIQYTPNDGGIIANDPTG